MLDDWNLDDRWLEIVDRAELGGNEGDITNKKKSKRKKGGW